MVKKLSDYLSKPLKDLWKDRSFQQAVKGISGSSNSPIVIYKKTDIDGTDSNRNPVELFTTASSSGAFIPISVVAVPTNVDAGEGTEVPTLVIGYNDPAYNNVVKGVTFYEDQDRIAGGATVGGHTIPESTTLYYIQGASDFDVYTYDLYISGFYQNSIS